MLFVLPTFTSRRMSGAISFAPVANRGDAECDEIVGRQFGEDVAIDIVLTKGLRVLLEPKSLQPIVNAFRHLLLHFFARSGGLRNQHLSG